MWPVNNSWMYCFKITKSIWIVGGLSFQSVKNTLLQKNLNGSGQYLLTALQNKRAVQVESKPNASFGFLLIRKPDHA